MRGEEVEVGTVDGGYKMTGVCVQMADRRDTRCVGWGEGGEVHVEEEDEMLWWCGEDRARAVFQMVTGLLYGWSVVAYYAFTEIATLSKESQEDKWIDIVNKNNITRTWVRKPRDMS